MESDVVEVLEMLPPLSSVKVHFLMCTELLKSVDRVMKIIPELEAARPGSSGIQALCLLNNGIEKAKLVIQDCSDSSKLYLAITGDAILSRCRKAMKLLNQSLCQIQHLVPIMLASKISRIISDLSCVTLNLDPSEEEAGKVLKTLLKQYSSATYSIEESAIKSICIATLRLHLTSPRAIVIEKRSIKKQLDKVGDDASAKKKILLYLLNLLKKYEKSIVRRKTQNARVDHEDFVSDVSSRDQDDEMECHYSYILNEAQEDILNKPTIPEEFRCPLSSRMLYDPVVIDSGQTFERMWIQKWFNEGHDTCPKTKQKLTHFTLTPNVTMKNLISNWCTAFGMIIPDPSIQFEAVQSQEASFTSVASLSNSMYNLCLPNDFSNVSLGSLDTSQTSDSSFIKMKINSDNMFKKTNGDSDAMLTTVDNHTKIREYLYELDELPWETQCKVVDDYKIHLKDDNQAVQFAPEEKFVEPLLIFLKKALDLNDVKAQRAGCLLLAFVTKCSGQYLNEGAYGLLASFIDSEVTEEAISIVEVLSCDRYCRSNIVASGAVTSIIQLLEIQRRELHEPALRILYNLSLDADTRSYIVSSGFISKLVRYFEDASLAKYCITILKNLFDYEVVRVSIVRTDGCLSSIAKMLEMDSTENQEHAVSLLLSLCSQHHLYCQLVMDEGVIPALVNISINGNDEGKASAAQLLRLLRVLQHDYDTEEGSGSDHNFTRDTRNDTKEQKPSSKPSGFFGKISIFSRSAPKKKR